MSLPDNFPYLLQDLFSLNLFFSSQLWPIAFGRLIFMNLSNSLFNPAELVTITSSSKVTSSQQA